MAVQCNWCNQIFENDAWAAHDALCGSPKRAQAQAKREAAEAREAAEEKAEEDARVAAEEARRLEPAPTPSNEGDGGGAAEAAVNVVAGVATVGVVAAAAVADTKVGRSTISTSGHIMRGFSSMIFPIILPLFFIGAHKGQPWTKKWWFAPLYICFPLATIWYEMRLSFVRSDEIWDAQPDPEGSTEPDQSS